MCTDVLILAGGVGERLWPVSTVERPKQFLRVSGGLSFLQSALLRAWNLHVSGSIHVITRSVWTDLVIADVQDLAERENLPDLPKKVTVMGEPCGKNTAPAAAWLSRLLETKTPGGASSILLMASDHVIGNTDQFVSDAETASWFAQRENLVSFAITPRSPSSGYGYIHAGSPLDCPVSRSAPAFVTESFREKPDEHTAERYLAEGSWYWNSGLYAFRSDFYLAELGKHAPGIAAAFSSPLAPEYRDAGGIRVLQEDPAVLDAYDKTPSVSIDYAVSEKCEQSVSVVARFDWDDVGSWDSLSQYFEQTESGTARIEAPETWVHSDIPVALCGVEDIIVVIRDGKAFISRKGQTNLLKEALGELRKKDAL